MRHHYFEQVKLLLKILPYSLINPSFALKGGTAINLFYRNMSRLSVDIDLCYLKIEPRDVSLKVIETELGLITQRIKDKFSNININTQS